MRKLLSILGLVFSCVLAQAAAVNWTNYVPNIQVATNANVANQLQLGTTFTDGHLWPNAPDGTTPWYLEHTVPHTGGNLFQLVDPLGPYFIITWLWEIQGSDLLLTGSAQVQGTVRGNDVVATNSLKVATTIKAAANLLEAPEIYLGASRIYRSALTPVDAGVSLNFASTNRYWSITLTGNVTFATANIVAGKRASLRVYNNQATNCTYTLPAWTAIGSALPTTIAAGKVGIFDLEANSTTDASIDSIYAQQP